jgi:hypothetical protein
MRGDDNVRGGHVGDLVLNSDSLGTKMVEDRFVVDQVAQNRDRPGLIEGQLDGVADAETHAQWAARKIFIQQ